MNLCERSYFSGSCNGERFNLVKNNRNDFGYETLFVLHYYDGVTNQEIGGVKIESYQNNSKTNINDLVNDNNENIYKKYDEYAIDNDLHKFDMKIDQGTENIVKKLYKNKLVNPKEKAGLYYEKIINYQKSEKVSSPIKFNDEFKTCLICHTSEVDNLDHYLPKAKYPILSLNPINLIPICIKCNRNKIDYIPKSKSDNLIHLYFDD